MRERQGILNNIDWITVLLFLMLAFVGWVNIYSAVYNEDHSSIFDFSQRYGKQLIWIFAAMGIALIIVIIDASFFITFAYLIYGISIVSLMAVLVAGTEIAGSKSWFQIGGIAIQPAEFAKFATSLALAKYLSTFNVSLSRLRTKIIASFIIFLPAALVLLQNDAGSALVYVVFILVLFREGLTGNILLIGLAVTVLFVVALLIQKIYIIAFLVFIAVVIFYFMRRSSTNIISLIVILLVSSAFVFSVDYAFDNVLEPHQKKRINVLLGKELDLRGAGYNVHQSKIAIGSGGIAGKGFLQGTQTKYDFVPEQDTDFIFCTIGEEWGYLGSMALIILFLTLLLRLIKLAERQRSNFSRIYGYGVASIIFFHFMVNIGMTIGLLPVIGIPLPFISYGGSSLWAFTILLFIFIRQDASRKELL
ncbi:MAG: rod shape-determining protein RodA [Bacteroidetes bacterium]|nr:MAG: rod shape-determining protein RodA [Bacteroidota bacterium]RLD82726.1 MAG: rod shape-determining protein RodA [Bacteroidota bacterium]